MTLGQPGQPGCIDKYRKGVTLISIWITTAFSDQPLEKSVGPLSNVPVSGSQNMFIKKEIIFCL